VPCDGVDQGRHGVRRRLHRDLDAEPLRRFRRHGSDGGDARARQQIGGLVGAVDLNEVLDRGCAGEGHHLQLAVEQHAVDVGPVIGLRLVEHGTIGDHLRDRRSAFPQVVGHHLAPDVGSWQ
jgi:hypothetical protein